jgi:hypothetical protein
MVEDENLSRRLIQVMFRRRRWGFDGGMPFTTGGSHVP